MSTLRAQDLKGKNISELRELFKNHTQEEVLEHHSNITDYFITRYLLNIAIEKGFKPTAYDLIAQIDDEHIDMFLNSLDRNESLKLIKSENIFYIPRQMINELIVHYIDAAPKAELLNELLTINYRFFNQFLDAKIPPQKMMNFLNSLDHSESLELITSENFSRIRDKFPEQIKEFLIHYLNTADKIELKDLFTTSNMLNYTLKNSVSLEVFEQKQSEFLNSLDNNESLEIIKSDNIWYIPRQMRNELIVHYIDAAPKADLLKELITYNNRICSSSSYVEVPTQKMMNFLNSLEPSESLELIKSENFSNIRDKFPEQVKEFVVHYIDSTPKAELKELFMNNSSLYYAAKNALGSEVQLDEKLVECFEYIKSFAELSVELQVAMSSYYHIEGVMKLIGEKLLASATSFQDLLDALADFMIRGNLNLGDNLENTILEFLDDKTNIDIYTKQFQEFHSKNQDDYSLTSPTLINRLKEVNALSIDEASTFLIKSSEAQEAEELLFSYVKSYNGALQYFVSINESVNIYEGLLINRKFDLLKRIENETELEIKIQPRHIFSTLFNQYLTSYKDRVTLVKDFWKYIDKPVLIEQLAFDGLTTKQIDLKFSIMDILRDFATESNNLNFYEMAILNPYDEICLNLNHMDFIFTQPQNSLGLSYFDLALLGGKAEFAKKLLDLGFKPNAYPEGFTSLDFLILNKNLDLYTLANLQLAILQSDLIDIDKQDENGQTPADMFVGQQGEIQNAVFAKSKDKIYEFFKGNYDAIDESRANVAISAGEGLWSSMSFATGRLLATKNDVDFYIVNMQAVNATNAAVFDKFDGWINPGAGDSYPKTPNGFNLDSWAPSKDIELMHFKALEHTDKLHIPYLGICAGAQHLALHHNSNVKPVNLQASSRDIILEKASLPNFMALNSAEQKEALTSCAISVPRFKGDTAHSFALDESNVGSTLNVGAVSETGIPMLYVHDNGIRFGKQFHAEHYYSSPPTTNNIPQKEILDNFVSIAKMHFAHRVEGGANPEDIMQAIAHRLSECVEHTYFNVFEDICPKSAEDVLRLEEYVEQYFA